MTSTVAEHLSWRQLAWLGAALLLALLACLLAGGLVAPAPSTSHSILSTICVDHQRQPHRWFQVWSVTGGPESCDRVEMVEDLMDTGLSSEQVVFAFQMPLLRGEMRLDFSRWQQRLIGVIQMDIDHDGKYEMLPNATLTLDARLGYKNKGDPTDEWTLLAASVEERSLSCDLDSERSYRYNCDLIPLFQLDSLQHDFYLLNLRLPLNTDNQRNIGIGRLIDINLVAIFQNGGFTKVFVYMKTVFFPLLVALLVWFCRRLRTLQRGPALIESLLVALSICLSLLNLPLEFLTLWFDMPCMRLITDLRQDIFYAVLLSFWLIFAGEGFMIRLRSRLSTYWRQLAFVALGCVSLAIFDTLEHGVPLTNPFHLIWGERAANNAALGFIIYISVLAGLYLCFLSWVIWCAVRVTKQQNVPAILSTKDRQHHEERECRCGFTALVSLVTLICAALTVTVFIVDRVAEGQWKWDEDISLNFVSASLTGVYGMWNVYTMAVLLLYASAGKRPPMATEENNPAKTEAPLIDYDQSM